MPVVIEEPTPDRRRAPTIGLALGATLLLLGLLAMPRLHRVALLGERAGVLGYWGTDPEVNGAPPPTQRLIDAPGLHLDTVRQPGRGTLRLAMFRAGQLHWLAGWRWK